MMIWGYPYLGKAHMSSTIIIAYLRRVRFKDNCDGAPTFAPGDFIMLNDGGRPGWAYVLGL